MIKKKVDLVVFDSKTFLVPFSRFVSIIIVYVWLRDVQSIKEVRGSNRIAKHYFR